MIETQVYETGLQQVSLERVPPEGEELGASSAELAAAIDDLARGWIVPLGVGLLVECCDPQRAMLASTKIRTTQRSWLVRVPEVPDGVSIAGRHRRAAIQVESSLDHATITRWVARAGAQPCESGHVAAVTEIIWPTVRVRLPIDDPFTVMDSRYELAACVEVHDGTRWAVGPYSSRTPAPVWLRGSIDLGVLSIALELRWDLWVAHPAMVDAGVARVLARPGWRRR